MFDKLTKSQTTIHTHKIAQSRIFIGQDHAGLKNPFKQTLPLKFPKNKIRKPTEMHMLKQTEQNPERYSVRTYSHANISVIDEVPIHKKLSNPGIFKQLEYQSQSIPVRLRTYQDLGVSHNEKRIFSRMHYKADPIIVGQKDLKHNSSLDRVWVQPRRYRDHGVQCQKTFNWNTKLIKREPFNHNKQVVQRVKKGGKTYKQLYQSAKSFKSGIYQ